MHEIILWSGRARCDSVSLGMVFVNYSRYFHSYRYLRAGNATHKYSSFPERHLWRPPRYTPRHERGIAARRCRTRERRARAWWALVQEWLLVAGIHTNSRCRTTCLLSYTIEDLAF